MAKSKKELKNYLNSKLGSILATLNESLDDAPDTGEQTLKFTLTVTGAENARAQIRLCRCRGKDDNNIRLRPCNECAP